MAGQVIMQGFLRRQIPIWLRRLVTMIPALAVIAINLDPTRTLVNHRITTLIITIVVGLIVVLNVYLLYQTYLTFFGG